MRLFVGLLLCGLLGSASFVQEPTHSKIQSKGLVRRDELLELARRGCHAGIVVSPISAWGRCTWSFREASSSELKKLHVIEVWAFYVELFWGP